MVDRASLIAALEPRVKPTGTQTEAIRKALEKALAELVIALPLDAALELPSSLLLELDVALNSLDQKQAEKLAASWEPKRKLDAEMKRAVKRDLNDLLHGRRSAYEPIAVSLDEARANGVAAYRRQIERAAPAKDLKALLSKWDKNLKPAPSTRHELVARLIALLDGAPLTAPKAASRRSRR